MAVTTQKSTLITNLEADPVVYPDAIDLRGKLRVYRFDFTQSGAGDANSTVDLFYLPPGRSRIYMPLSEVHTSAWGTGTSMDIGWAAHTDIEGDAVAVDVDGLVNGADIAAAGLFSEAELRSGAGLDDLDTKLIETRERVLIQAIALGAGIPDAATMKGHFIVASE